MKILAFAATSSRDSINKKLVTYAVDVLKADILEDPEIELIDLNDFEMPLYSIDRENEGGIPQKAHQFFQKIGQADVLLISYAEHNGSYTAAFKNLYDWASRIDAKVYQNKSVVLLATSPGPGGAGSVLESAKQSAPFFGADVKSTLSIPSFFDNFDTKTGRITGVIDQQLRAALSTLK